MFLFFSLKTQKGVAVQVNSLLQITLGNISLRLMTLFYLGDLKVNPIYLILH